MSSFYIEEQKGLAYHLEGLRVLHTTVWEPLFYGSASYSCAQISYAL